MEKRLGKIIASHAGGNASKGAMTYKVSLPTSWIRQMGIEETRKIEIGFDGTTISIEKPTSPLEFAKSKLLQGHKIKKLLYYDNQTLCTVMYADFTDKTIRAENYVKNAIKCAFGNNPLPDWDVFQTFLAERCIPKERSGIREYLEAIGIDAYNPVEIIKKTEGRMAEDNQWLKMEDFK